MNAFLLHEGKAAAASTGTWCAPCLAGETSPKADWLEMVPDIRGDHYYLTDRQLKTILNRLGSNGYPTYGVMSRDGMNLSVLSGYNEEKLKNLIDKALR